MVPLQPAHSIPEPLPHVRHGAYPDRLHAVFSTTAAGTSAVIARVTLCAAMLPPGLQT